MAVATAAAILGGSALVGGIMSGNAAKKGAQAQIDAANRNAALFAGIKVPTIEEQKIILQTPALMGQYSPEQLQGMSLNISEMEGVKADQSTVDAQNQALQGIGEVAKGGYSESDKATAREIQRTVSQDAQARQKSILNAMASRGTLGSGMELAAQLQGNQQAAEQMSRGGEGLTQQAQARALQALGQQGSLAGQMRGQQFSEKSQIAQAQDAINKFNTMNRQNVNESNMGLRNQAQMTNLQMKQNQEDLRARNANSMEEHNKGLIDTDYRNRLARAQGIASGNAQIANAEQAKQNANAGMISGIAQGIGTIAGSYGAQQNALDLIKAKKGMASNE